MDKENHRDKSPYMDDHMAGGSHILSNKEDTLQNDKSALECVDDDSDLVSRKDMDILDTNLFETPCKLPPMSISRNHTQLKLSLDN